MRVATLMAGLGCVLVGLLAPGARATDDDGNAFFEARIRPVLVKECYGCHAAGAKNLKGGLRLDTRDHTRAGGDSGPAVVPGKPDESLLLTALKYDELAMPPKGKLPDTVVADFERWIKLGAPDPREETSASTPKAKAPAGVDLAAGRDFWAYRVPTSRPVPIVRDAAWSRSDLDRFVLAGLEAKGLRPAPDAEPRALLRRLSFDLVGLPPTPEELQEFAADPSPLAYEKAVDRLLASPRFGERWARHWFDIARYAESLTLRGMVFPQAWRYRDYVIDTFNADRPFDQFVREQIAGDLLPDADLAVRRRRLVATTFLVLGNVNLEEQDKAQLRMDAVDEQLDTIGKALLAQTIGCARCHDHKFDPIPTRDYYALAGILRNTRAMEHANVSKWIDVPLPETPGHEAALAQHDAAVAALTARIKALQARAGQAGAKAGGVLGVASLPGVVVDDVDARKVGDWVASTHSGTYIGAGYLHDGNAGKGERSLTFATDVPATGSYDVWLAYSPGTSRAAAVPITIMGADGEKELTVDLRPAPTVEGRFLALGTHRFEKGGQSYVLISNTGTTGHVTADAVVFTPAGTRPTPRGAASRVAATDPALPALERELARLKATGPRRELAMSVVEEPEISDARVHIRGSVHTLGDTVPRGFLQVASQGAPPTLPTHESGRRELAEWLASRSNPLTARVLVNRAWHWLFGAGLVRTTDNFGTTGERPSHPELLDTLAVGFMDDGWSVKRLVRRIVLSRTYQQASTPDPKDLEADPENRAFGRANRRRMEAECLRDAMLAVSGQLRQEMGGPSFPEGLAADYGFDHRATRRSVYVPVFRNALPEIDEVFDFADPSMVVGRRNVSTVAPQALFLLNDPFVTGQARATASRLLADPTDDRARLGRLYVHALGRSPTEAERTAALRFVASSEGDRVSVWTGVVQAVFGSIDFRYVD